MKWSCYYLCMSMSDTPPTDRSVVIAADGSWFCGSCYSLNPRGTLRCYKCRSQFPYAAPKDGRVASRSWVRLGAGALILAIIVTAGIIAGYPGGSTSASELSQPSYDQSSPGTSDVLAAVDTPSARQIVEATSTPSVTLAPTAGPTITEGPTIRPTAPPLPGVALPSSSARISGVSVKYYKISGDSGDALISGMISGGAVACGVSDAAACFYHTFKWTFIVNQVVLGSNVGKCSVVSVKFAATYTIILPKWTGPARVSAALAACMAGTGSNVSGAPTSASLVWAASVRGQSKPWPAPASGN